MVSAVSSEVDRDLKPIRELHFVVHPGMIAGDSRRLAKKFPDYDQRQKILTLFDSYRNKAHQLAGKGADDLVIVFLHKDRLGIEEDLRDKESTKPAYLALAREIKRVLKDRVIVFSSSFNFASPSDVEKLKKLIELRGYRVDENTLPKAWGELVGACLDAYPGLAKLELGIERPTEVLYGLTERRLRL